MEVWATAAEPLHSATHIILLAQRTNVLFLKKWFPRCHQPGIIKKPTPEWGKPTRFILKTFLFHRMTTTASIIDDKRYNMLIDWLSHHADKHHLKLDAISRASTDASFRRYFRLQTTTGNTIIAMDAPPEQENSAPFVHVTNLLNANGLRVPILFEQDLSQGFLLIEDLGTQTYYHAIQQGLSNEQLQELYRSATQTLVKMQQTAVAGRPVYDKKRLLDELTLFEQWYVIRHKKQELNDEERQQLQSLFKQLVNHNVQAANVFVHRDYHSPNLIIADTNGLQHAPGVIDYQDALVGPITYDIASLVMDARTTWDEAQQLDWAIRYWEAARAANLPVPEDFAEFHQAYEWMSLQRNLRVLGVFSRLSYRDNKHQYLDHLPRVNAYIRQVARRYQPFGPLLRILNRLDNITVSTGYTF